MASGRASWRTDLISYTCLSLPRLGEWSGTREGRWEGAKALQKHLVSYTFVGDKTEDPMKGKNFLPREILMCTHKTDIFLSPEIMESTQEPYV